MTSPVYIIAANEIIEDKSTNLASVISIVEKLQVYINSTPATHPEAGSLALVNISPVKCLAVWMLDADDQGPLEHQFVIQGLDLMIESPIMPVTPSAGFRLQRFIMTFQLPPLTKSGIMHVHSKLRREGHADWMEQSYPIEVVAIQVAAEPAQQMPADATISQ